MSFREKSAWICLLTTLVVFIPYFSTVFGLVEGGGLTVGALVTAFAGATVFLIVLNVVAHIAAAALGRPEAADERDIAIGFTAFRNAYFTIGSSVFLVMLAAMVLDASSRSEPFVWAIASQLLLLCFVLAEVAKYLTQVICYRGGA
jgi:hypothetical protein